MPIVSLALEHETAFREFLADFAAAGETRIPAMLTTTDRPQAEIVGTLDAWSRGEQLPAGWVPNTTRFLMEGGRFLGVSNLRHRLTDALIEHGGHVGYSVRPSARGQGHATRLLMAAKTAARGLGIDRMLVTCDRDNLASARVIEKCGGALWQEGLYEPLGVVVRRYWILLDR
jgi:predicted acetyltransferase